MTKTMPSLARALLVSTLVALGAGCVTLDTGGRFIEQDPGTAAFRAVTADEARLQVREFDVKDGDVEFWVAALHKNFVDGRGYVVVDEGEIKAADGKTGALRVYETRVGGRPVRYLVALFVNDALLSGKTIRVVEYVADKGVFDGHRAVVEDAIREMK